MKAGKAVFTQSGPTVEALTYRVASSKEDDCDVAEQEENMLFSLAICVEETTFEVTAAAGDCRHCLHDPNPT
ncbi:hypothetical protein GCK32_006963 [Trichostrongylus colubriformis]|uniref:Uncharacterized protein n=1 Tax=Trichostrongylus colubriformis TaxID=6319 RepID=A0AAN8FYP2_TRICO